VSTVLPWGRRVLALFIWTYGAWILLTWTRTWSQLLFGVALAIIVSVACAPLGGFAEPWKLLSPFRLGRTVVLIGDALARVVRANLVLARRIWTPSLPLRSGMVIVPTEFTSEGALAGVGIITSVIVDNQIVNCDVANQELQYHAVWIDSENPEENRKVVNGPIEEHLRHIGAK
jgi:multicomponent Na+:H+ antiporter subunit E